MYSTYIDIWWPVRAHQQDPDNSWEYHKKAKGFVWNINNIAEQFGMKELEFSPAVALSEVPPWMLPFPVINTEYRIIKREKRLPRLSKFC